MAYIVHVPLLVYYSTYPHHFRTVWDDQYHRNVVCTRAATDAEKYMNIRNSSERVILNLKLIKV